MPELFQILSSKSTREWESLQNLLEIKHSKKFAESIQELGKEYNLNKLELWGNNFLDSVMDFNKTKIINILKEFPDLVKDIEKISIGESEYL